MSTRAASCLRPRDARQSHLIYLQSSVSAGFSHLVLPSRQSPMRVADPPITPVSWNIGRCHRPVDQFLHFRVQLRVLGLQLRALAE